MSKLKCQIKPKIQMTTFGIFCPFVYDNTMHEGELNNLFRLLKLIGGKFILVEDGNPQAVLLSYDEFQEMALPGAIKKVAETASRIEDVNKQITTAQLLDLREEVIQDLPDEIKIEPLD